MNIPEIIIVTLAISESGCDVGTYENSQMTCGALLRKSSCTTFDEDDMLLGSQL